MKSYFLIYRRRIGRKLRWTKPVGGLVMEAKRIYEGLPVADFALAGGVAEQRYHCSPHEELIVAEVFERHEQRLAMTLHKKWEADFAEFEELMSDST